MLVNQVAMLYGVLPSQVLHLSPAEFHLNLAMGLAVIQDQKAMVARLPKSMWGDLVAAVAQGTRLGR